QLEHADGRGNRASPLGDVSRMLAPRLIRVGDDDDVASAQCGPRAFLDVVPLPGALWIARRDEVVARQSLDVLLALDDEDELIDGGLEQLRKSVDDAANVANAPQPPARPVWL